MLVWLAFGRSNELSDLGSTSCEPCEPIKIVFPKNQFAWQNVEKLKVLTVKSFGLVTKLELQQGSTRD